ncbi:hypothetical protein [Streptomyces xantholiticus]|uniref:hypothetical protein n=1 Tax=Streptomyces xantholiticus TaxID=68285 RepID=UPI001676BFB6|nr:hypothetical protein [Streptomyces xantholiticus]GGW71744.1 hypothetical protein GCM10010381_65510 [Streptomyces xantholiticus]
MNIYGARVPVAGATGVLGGERTAEVAGRGARTALAGRDSRRLPRAAQAPSRAAPSAGLHAVRREARGDGVGVPDVRPGHLNTCSADRPMVGTALPLLPGGDPRQVAATVADAPATDADAPATDAEVLRTAPNGTPVVERRAR